MNFSSEYSTIRLNIPKKSGIYKIYNIVTNQIYYGSSQDLRIRFYDHRSNLLKDSHPNPHLQNSKNKYGINNFYFEILEFVDKDNILKKEQEYLDRCDRTKCFNICFIAGNTKGVKMSEKCKKALRYSSMIRRPWNKIDTEKTYLTDKQRQISETLRKSCSGSKTKLTWDLAREIRKKYRENFGLLSTRDLGNIFRVDCSQISRIINNKTWKEVIDVT